jgi:hypothetical protein
MSKSALRKFKKNDFTHDDEEDFLESKNKVDKRKQRRFERAMKTKDIGALIENEEYDDWD